MSHAERASNGQIVAVRRARSLFTMCRGRRWLLRTDRQSRSIPGSDDIAKHVLGTNKIISTRAALVIKTGSLRLAHTRCKASEVSNHTVRHSKSRLMRLTISSDLDGNIGLLTGRIGALKTRLYVMPLRHRLGP